MDPMVNPRPNHVITLQPGHVRVPVVSKLVNVATTKSIRVAQPQPCEIRTSSTGQNIRGRGQPIQGRRRSRRARQVNPRRGAGLGNNSSGVKVIQDDLITTGTTPKIEGKILWGKRKDRRNHKQRRRIDRHLTHKTNTKNKNIPKKTNKQNTGKRA